MTNRSTLVALMAAIAGCAAENGDALTRPSGCVDCSGENAPGDPPGPAGSTTPSSGSSGSTGPSGGDAGAPAIVAQPLAAGSTAWHTCAFANYGEPAAWVMCWGRNDFGELGQGDTANRGNLPPGVQAPTVRAVMFDGPVPTQIAVGQSHTCALFDDHRVKCWGWNAYGQLGVGDTATRGDDPSETGASLPPVALGLGRTALEIGAGMTASCAILDDHSVKCWGQGMSLGLGDPTSRGKTAAQLGDALPAVRLGTGRTAAHISVGGVHTCVILDTGAIKCWGDNTFGELGLGDTNGRGQFDPNEMGDALGTVDLGPGRTALAVAAGYRHTCAILDDHSVKCWGENEVGQLGIGTTAAHGKAPGQMGAALPAVDLGPARTALAVGAGFDFTCALLDDHTIKCWGGNTSGQLGLGDKTPRGNIAGTMGSALPTVALGTATSALALAVGGEHACARLQDNWTVKCWGGNTYGDLGVGDTSPRGDDLGEMGDALPKVGVLP